MAYPQTVANPFAVPATANGAPATENPFATAPAPNTAGQTAQAGNPFDPMATPPQDPFAAPQPASTNPMTEPGVAPSEATPFTMTGAPTTQQQPMQVPPSQQYPPQQQVAPQGLPAAGYQQVPPSNPFQTTALVPSQQPANPYAGLVAPQQQPQPAYGAASSQAIVSTGQPTSQWSVAPTGGAAAATFDPFAPPPPPAPAPAPPPAPTPAAPVVDQMIQQDPFSQQPPAVESQHLVVSTLDQDVSPQYQLPPQNLETSSVAAPPVQEVSAAVSSGQSVVSEPSSPVDRQPSREMVPFQRPSVDNPAAQVANSPQTKYGRILAQNAPPDASALPRAELVRKSGYVLSRISFRTIIMKKWKQSFWVQYGPHTMIWFRSQSDFNDWLNNPYHTQGQRNFLIKLAVNFVHDLYRPNVRGYQVTQSRTKAYGRNLMKQFKLERWMDYGPTIAAAFASRDPKEVDALREAIVECMRNTPQDSGIRATGAVRQDYNPERRANGDEHHYQPYQYDSERQGARHDDYEDASYNGSHSQSYAESSSRRQSTQDEDGYLGGSERTDVAPAPAAAAPVADLLDFTDAAPSPAAPTPAAGGAVAPSAGPPPPPTAGPPPPAAYQYNVGVPPHTAPQQMQPQYQY